MDGWSPGVLSRKNACWIGDEGFDADDLSRRSRGIVLGPERVSQKE